MTLKAIAIYLLAAVLEIAGCYGLHKSLKSDWSVAAGMVSILILGLFGILLTFVTNVPGRAYAAYGGIYILAATAWLFLVDKEALTLSDTFGVFLAVTGSVVILTQALD